MGAGDEIIAAGMAQKMFERDPQHRPVAILDRWNRPRWHEVWNGNPAIATPTAFARHASVQRLKNASGCRPYIVYPFTPKTGWTFNRSFRARDYVATIYLSDAERKRGERALAKYGPYVLIEPFTDHQNFRWPIERWAQVVEACPDLTFVQHTHRFCGLVPGAKAEPASLRECFGLIASARTYARSESGPCHAAAALGVPTVTLWGGCMDADVLGGYPLQTSLVDRGPGSPCGKWERCAHCSACMDRITVDAVVAGIRTSLQKKREAA